jgi:hypothetical protein
MLRAYSNPNEVVLEKCDKGRVTEDALALRWQERHAAELTNPDGNTRNFDGSKMAGKRVFTATTTPEAVEEGNALTAVTFVNLVDEESAWQRNAKTKATELLRSRGYSL